jgi:hypothetical protein
MLVLPAAAAGTAAGASADLRKQLVCLPGPVGGADEGGAAIEQVRRAGGPAAAAVAVAAAGCFAGGCVGQSRQLQSVRRECELCVSCMDRETEVLVM